MLKQELAAHCQTDVIAGERVGKCSDLVGRAQDMKGHCHDLFHFWGVNNTQS